MRQIFFNANVITMDPQQPKASAVVIDGERIAYVGTNEDALALRTKAEKIIDLEGLTLLPGFNDSHMHFTAYAMGRSWIDLSKIQSIDGMKTIIRKKRNETVDGRWIIGRGWDQNLFADSIRMPCREDLDEACPDLPVVLMRTCSHIAVCNSRALSIAGIGLDTTSTPGSSIVRDGYGRATGLLKEAGAIGLVQRHALEKEYLQFGNSDFWEAAMSELLQSGLTSVTEAGNFDGMDELVVSSYRLMSEKRLLKLRFNIYLDKKGLSAGLLDQHNNLNYHNNPSEMMKIMGLKIMGDGSLGGRTAALEEPYQDEPGNKGIMVTSSEEIDDLVESVHKRNLQVAIHAIGDRAAGVALKAIEKAQAKHPRKASRHRLEHCQVLNPKLISMMQKLGVIASIQPHFISTDLHWADKRLGPNRIKYSYAWGELHRRGIPLAAGSDCPVEVFSPLAGIRAAINRTDSKGNPAGGWLPQQKISLYDALVMYTRGGAYATFDEKEKGTVSRGKLADLVVLSDNPFKVPADKIELTDVLMTMVGGKIMHDKLKKS